MDGDPQHLPAREVVARGDRLLLARFRADDVDAVHRFAGDPAVCRHTAWGPNTLEQSRDFVHEVIDPDPERLDLAIIRPGEGGDAGSAGDDLIGSGAVWTTSAEHRSGELGHTLRADCWGRGYATEVAHLLLELGLGALGLERVAGSCSPDNLASARVLEKIGMRREGVLRGLYIVRGQRQDRLRRHRHRQRRRVASAG